MIQGCSTLLLLTLGKFIIAGCQSITTTVPPSRLTQSLPSAVDYSNIAPSPGDQGGCNAAGAFAAVSLYESIMIRRNVSLELSEQVVLECSQTFSVTGLPSNCERVQVEDALNYLASIGGVSRLTYSYTAFNYNPTQGTPSTPGICDRTDRIKIGNGSYYTYSFTMSATQLKSILIEQGPVVAMIYTPASFGFYNMQDTVYSDCPDTQPSADQLTHAVLLIGYDDGQGTWRIMNSYGAAWGFNGQLNINYNRDCGIRQKISRLDISSYYEDPAITISPEQLVFERNPPATSTTSSGDSTLDGWIVGLIIILSILLLLAIIYLFYLCIKMRNKNKQDAQGSATGKTLAASQTQIPATSSKSRSQSRSSLSRSSTSRRSGRNDNDPSYSGALSKTLSSNQLNNNLEDKWSKRRRRKR